MLERGEAIATSGPYRFGDLVDLVVNSRISQNALSPPLWTCPQTPGESVAMIGTSRVLTVVVAVTRSWPPAGRSRCPSKRNASFTPRTMPSMGAPHLARIQAPQATPAGFEGPERVARAKRRLSLGSLLVLLDRSMASLRRWVAAGCWA